MDPWTHGGPLDRQRPGRDLQGVPRDVAARGEGKGDLEAPVWPPGAADLQGALDHPAAVLRRKQEDPGGVDGT